MTNLQASAIAAAIIVAAEGGDYTSQLRTVVAAVEKEEMKELERLQT